MVKAGRAGSSPDGVAKHKKPTSQPFDVLLRDIGQAVSALNTIVVGLDAVEKGHKKPDTLNISWNPDNRIAASRKARKFVLVAILVRVSEAIVQFANSIVVLPRLDVVRSAWTGRTTNAQKVQDVLGHFLASDLRVSGAVLLIHWRNRIVHRNSNASLTSNQKRLLQFNEAAIAEKYGGLIVDRLLAHFEEGRPTLKDVSFLVSVCINVARQIDNDVFKNLAKDDVEAWLNHYGLVASINQVRAETSPEKVEASIRRLFMSQAPLLLDGYLRYFSNEKTDGRATSAN